MLANKFDQNPSQFLVTIIADNQCKRILHQNLKIEDLIQKGTVILYEINPALRPSLPPVEQSSKTDSNHGIDPKFTKVITYMMEAQKS